MMMQEKDRKIEATETGDTRIEQAERKRVCTSDQRGG